MKVGDLVALKNRNWTYGRRKFRVIKQFADGSFRLGFARAGDGWVERYEEKDLKLVK